MQMICESYYKRGKGKIKYNALSKMNSRAQVTELGEWKLHGEDGKTP